MSARTAVGLGTAVAGCCAGRLAYGLAQGVRMVGGGRPRRLPPVEQPPWEEVASPTWTSRPGTGARASGS